MKERLINTKKRFAKKIIVKNKPIIIGLLFIIILGVVVVPSIFATLQPIKSIEILSSDPSYYSKEDGAWKVTNSAEFISSDTALVTMDLDTIAKGSSNYKDVIFLIDTSESMIDERLSTLKSGVVASIEKIMKDENNKVGIISFNSSSTIVSSLSNNKSDLISKVNSLTSGVGTSYYQALINLDNMLKIYENDENRELKVVFITDGIPSKDSPNEVGEYQYLKDKYSYLKIDAVQYEAGEEVFETLKNISDREYIVSSNDLEKKLISISTSATSYEEFTIKEYLNNDNFMVESIDNINVDTGSVSLDSNVITWNLNNIGSGSKAKMTFKAKLKNTSNGIYKLNDEIKIYCKLAGWGAGSISSPSTPVLSNSYKVKYDGNKPGDCTISGVPDEATHKVFETVSIVDSPKCSGYQFKGWDIVTDNVTKVNEDYFVMPKSDVELKANWSKLNIRKSTEGKLKESLTLYKQVEEDVSESGKYAAKYLGDTSTFAGDKNVYYYYGEASNNNVIFANYCWKIVRTTDTGGVKLLYNGVPSNGSCNNTGFASVLTAEQMGTSSNEVAFNNNSDSLADVGYMYNTRYTKKSYVQSTSTFKIISGKISKNNIGAYPFDTSSNVEYRDGKYYLTDAEVKSGNLTGFFYCEDGSTSCKSVRYIVYEDDNIDYYYVFENGRRLGDYSSINMLYGSEILLGENSYYNLQSTDSFYNNIHYNMYMREDGFYSKDLYIDRYICLDGSSSCTSPKYVFDMTIDNSGGITLKYVNYDQVFMFGKSFTYSNGEYSLNYGSNSKVVGDWANDYKNLNNYHYTCFNRNGKCSTLYYVYYGSSRTASYIELVNGKSINDAINEMLYNDDVNKYNSTIKTAIDYWYENTMTEYTKYLEDTVWCNERSMRNQSTNGWNPNGGSLSTDLNFKSYNSSLMCTNKNDQFSVNSSNGNGALTYPVGLLTANEIDLSYSSGKLPFTKGISYRTLTPYGMGYIYNVYSLSSPVYSVMYSNVSSTSGVAPAVSLRTGIEYLGGDGSANRPYVIATD